MLRKLLSTVLFMAFFVPAAVLAQTGSIEGTVTDAESGESIPGANVLLLENNRGAATDAEGHYEISNIEPGTYTIRVSFVGYNTIEESISIEPGVNTRDFQLSMSLSDLEEVVVTGIASRTSKAVAEVSVARVDANELTEVNAFSGVSELLNSKVAGVKISSSSGNVGSGFRFRVRSGGGLNGNGQPVIYIDGVRVDNSEVEGFGVGGQGVSVLSSLNPENIASINVLKGPAASALYGTDGSNGVVLISTKNGSGVIGEDGISIDYKNVTGWNAQSSEYTEDQFLSHKDINAIFREGSINQHTLSLGGGTNFIRYYTSFDSRVEEGILRNNAMDRKNFRANFEAFPTEELTIKVNASYSNTDLARPNNDNNIYGFLGNTILAFNGDPYYFTDSAAVVGIEDNLVNNRFIGSVNMTWSPIENLEAQATIGYDGTDLRQDQTFPANLSYATVPAGSRSIYMRRNYQLTYDLNARYSYDVGPDINMTSLVGAQLFNRKLQTAFFSKQDFSTSLITNIGAGETFISGDESFEHVRSAGIFAQQQINYDQTYFLTLGLRQDFASSIGVNAPNIFYPKASAAVRIDKLGVLPSAINFLKVRAAYGESGQLPDLTDGVAFLWEAEPSGYGAGAVLDVIGNPEIKPERVKEIEIGLEAEFFERAGFDVTYYNTSASESIVGFENSPSTGLTASSQPFNIGNKKGWGIESSFYVTPIRSQDFQLDLNLLWAYSQNEVTDLGDAQPIFDGFDLNVIKEGLPQAAFYTNEILGATFNPDGTYAGPEVSEERVFIGTPYPEHQGSFSVNFRFLKNFNLYVLTDWQINKYIFNNTALFASLFGNNAEYKRLQAKLGLAEFEDIEAFEPGTAAYEEAANQYAMLNPNYDWGYVQPADFFKLRELSLSYNFSDLLNRFGASTYVRNLTVAFSARNIYTSTLYEGADPEVNFSGSRGLTRGQDFLTLQNPSSYFLTVRLGL